MFDHEMLANPRSLPRQPGRHVFVDIRSGAQIAATTRLDSAADAFRHDMSEIVTPQDLEVMDEDHRKSFMAFAVASVSDILGISLKDKFPNPIEPIEGVFQVGPFVSWNVSLQEKASLDMVELLEAVIDDLAEHDQHLADSRVEKAQFYRDEWEGFHEHMNKKREVTKNQKHNSQDDFLTMVQEVFGGDMKVIDLGSFKL